MNIDNDNNQNGSKKEEISSKGNTVSIYDLFGIEKKDYQKIKKEEKKTPSPLKSTKSSKNVIILQKEEEIEENYIKINTKNQFDLYNNTESSNKLSEIINYVDKLLDGQSNSDSVSHILLEKLFPKCLNKAFLISKMTSKRLMKTKKINKKIIEEKIKYFFDKRIEIRYSKKLILNKECINNLGYILSYSYSKFDDFRIMEKKDLITYINASRKTDTINEFFNYCNKTGKSPIDNIILEFLENKNNNYHLPGEFIFLINIFDCLNILEINMNIEIDKSKEENEDDFYFFIITILNIHYLAILTNHFKVIFNNIQLENDLYLYYTEELNSIYNNYSRFIKKNKEKNIDEIHKKRWDFEIDYIPSNKSKIFSNKEDVQNPMNINNYNNQIINEENSISLEIGKIEDSFYSKNTYKNIRSGSLFIKSLNTTNLSQLRSQRDSVPEFDLFEAKKKNLTYVEKTEKKKKIIEYEEILDKNKNILELIYFVCLGILRLKNLKNLDLIMNDCFNKEFIYLFKHYYSTPKSSKAILNFHLLNNFIKKMQKLQKFNFEFNSLDYLSFYKLLSIINRNEELNSLQISFFSSLISYSPQLIYKLYQQHPDKKEINKNELHRLESFLLHELLGFFIENLEVLFELIKSKISKFELLSFNFDVPEIIAARQRYLMGILKFILNILILVDNKKSKIKKLIILSPKIKFDSRSMTNIEEILDTFDIDKKNKAINELSIQIQFYKIGNVKNLISHNLITLKIGEMDIFSLRGLTKHLCSYSFFKKSSLQSLTIGILNSFSKFSKEVEYLLNELFSIKIKTLKEIRIYSNLFIKDEKSLYQIVRYNWIPSCIFTLNEKSKLSWKQKEIEEKINQIIDENRSKNENNNIKYNEKKILYLIHHELEEEIMTANELVARNKRQMKKTDCEVAWYLRYKLIFEYSKKYKFKLNYYDLKNITFNILKFLYFTKTVKIQNEIN